MHRDETFNRTHIWSNPSQTLVHSIWFSMPMAAGCDAIPMRLSWYSTYKTEIWINFYSPWLRKTGFFRQIVARSKFAGWSRSKVQQGQMSRYNFAMFSNDYSIERCTLLSFLTLCSQFFAISPFQISLLKIFTLIRWIYLHFRDIFWGWPLVSFR